MSATIGVLQVVLVGIFAWLAAEFTVDILFSSGRKSRQRYVVSAVWLGAMLTVFPDHAEVLVGWLRQNQPFYFVLLGACQVLLLMLLNRVGRLGSGEPSGGSERVWTPVVGYSVAASVFAVGYVLAMSFGVFGGIDAMWAICMVFVVPSCVYLARRLVILAGWELATAALGSGFVACLMVSGI